MSDEIPYDPDRIVSSYTRMSTRKQVKGDSLRRQLAAATAWVQKHGGILDSMQDIGVSAYRGANRKRGALAAYIERVQSGEIPPGSVLFVENIDRLSRETPYRAYDTLRSLLGQKIYVVLDDLKWILSEQTLIENSGRMQDLFNFMQRSHNDSRTKSTRTLEEAEARRQRATTKVPYSKTGPAWLTWTETKWIEHEKRAQVVRDIFELAIKGNGSYKIAIFLNQRGVATFGRSKAWQSSYVSKILRNPAVVGTWQPMRLIDGKEVPVGDPILDHFPAVIDKADFLKVQREILPKTSPGAKGKHFTNLFTGRCVCDACGSPMTLISSQKAGKTRFGYLVCVKKARYKACDAVRNFRSDLVEDAVLRHVHVDLGRIVRDETRNVRVRTLRTQIGDAEYKLEQLKAARANLTTALGAANQDAFSYLTEAINQRSSEIAALGTEIAALRDELEKLRVKPPDLAANLERLRTRLEQATDEERYRLRARLAHLLREFILEVRCDPMLNEVRVAAGESTLYFSGAGDLIGVALPRYGLDDPALRDWSEHTQHPLHLLPDAVRFDTTDGAVLFKLTYAPG